MTEMTYWSANRIARKIREGSLSAATIVEAYLGRISQVNPQINAVVQLAAERALLEAERLDELAARGEFVGPLHGVPITLKDSIDTQGIISTGGTMGRKEFTPEKDAPVAARQPAGRGYPRLPWLRRYRW